MISIEDYCSKIKSLIEEVSLGVHKAEDVQDTTRLIADLGMDSLDYATVFLSCEQWAQIKVQEDGVVWADIQTVAQLAALFYGAGHR